MVAKMETYKVYVHINNINNKVYVGITGKQNINLRWCGGNGYRINYPIGNAIKKYGWDNFQHIVIADNLTSCEAKNFEKLIIKGLGANIPSKGYNLTDGGDGTCGYKRPDLAKRNENGRKRVDQYTLEGEYIQTFPSIRGAAKLFGNENKIRKGITNTCKKNQSHSYGYIWRYSNREITPVIKEEFLKLKTKDPYNKGKSYVDMDRVKLACEIYDKNMYVLPIKDMAKLIGRSHMVFTGYLKIGVTNGWCKYDASKSRNIANKLKAIQFI
jgi:hypothetical protein